jgi:Spy/CpxP family protein refolding chaperone
MKKMSQAVLGAAALALVLGVGQAQAQPPQGTGPKEGAMGRGHDRQQSIARALGLTDQQQEKVRQILDEQRPQREALQEKIQANRDALRQMLEDGTADATAVGELVLEGRKLHDQGHAMRVADTKKIRALLTPEQQTKLDAIEALREEHGPGGWRGPGGHFGGPGPGEPR